MAGVAHRVKPIMINHTVVLSKGIGVSLCTAFSIVEDRGTQT